MMIKEISTRYWNCDNIADPKQRLRALGHRTFVATIRLTSPRWRMLGGNSRRGGFHRKVCCASAFATRRR